MELRLYCDSSYGIAYFLLTVLALPLWHQTPLLIVDPSKRIRFTLLGVLGGWTRMFGVLHYRDTYCPLTLTHWHAVLLVIHRINATCPDLERLVGALYYSTEYIYSSSPSSPSLMNGLLDVQ